MKLQAAGVALLIAVALAARAQEQPAPSSTAKEPIVTGNQTIKINFPEMDLESVLKNFSAITGKSFILDKMPQGKIITVGPIGPVEIPREQALRLFMLIMDMNGFVVVKTSVDKVYKVVPKAEAIKEGMMEIYPPGKAPEPSENMVTRFIRLRYLDAAEIVPQLSALSTKDGGQVMAYAPLNMLVIVDTAVNIERMLKIISILDVPTPAPEMEIVVLKYSNPQEMAGILSQVFDLGAASVPGRTATTRPTPPSRRKGGSPEAPAPPTPPVPTPGVEGGGGTTKIIPVDRLNALVIIADRSTMIAMKEMIAKLDVDIGLGGTIHVYYVQNAEAVELAGILANLAGRGGGFTAPGRTRTTPETSPLPGLAQPPPSTAPAPTGPRSTATTINLPGILTGEVSITADDATNALIVIASPQDWAVLREVIQKLDIPRRQVFVEAVLLEITYEETQSAGVSIHGASPLEDQGVLLAGTNFGEPSSLGVLQAVAAGGGSLTLPTGLTLGALGRAVEVPGTGGKVIIPSAGIVVKLLATYSDVNVLSTPTLLTMDNQEASIEVGEKIPVPTGQTIATAGFANVNITRESVGIKLKITPQINESDNIKMDIYTEISSAVGQAHGIDVNVLGVTTSNKTAQTSVIVRDSQTIVIGGLMKDTDSERNQRVPFLGDIPVVGWLFKTASKTKTKTNLIILITPHIVKSDREVERVNEYVREGYSQMQDETRGKDALDWDKYFESQMPGGPGETGPESPSPEWEWTPSPREEDLPFPAPPSQPGPRHPPGDVP